jgi:alkylhydroperoxidase family enzyme
MTTNYERAFAKRPDVYAAWLQLNGAIKAGMDLRRYELATLAAARRLRSSYCCLAHGTVLIENFGEPVREIAIDHRSAGLDELDIGVMDLAERVVEDATSIDDAYMQRLRKLGLSETEIMDVVLAAAARCFFSKTLDALDVRADGGIASWSRGCARRSSSAGPSPTLRECSEASRIRPATSSSRGTPLSPAETGCQPPPEVRGPPGHGGNSFNPSVERGSLDSPDCLLDLAQR